MTPLFQIPNPHWNWVGKLGFYKKCKARRVPILVIISISPPDISSGQAYWNWMSDIYQKIRGEVREDVLDSFYSLIVAIFISCLCNTEN